MDLRVVLRDMRKKRMTDMGAVNVIISSKEEADNGRLESRRKRKADHAGPSVMRAQSLQLAKVLLL